MSHRNLRMVLRMILSDWLKLRLGNIQMDWQGTAAQSDI